MKSLSYKKYLIFFILFSFFIPHECFASKTDKYYILGLSKSGVKKTLTTVKLKSFQHPTSFKDKDLYKILISLYHLNYMDRISLWEVGKKPVFQPKEAKKITPLIRKSLEKSTPGQMVYFSIGKSNKKTTGNIFFAQSKLYFHFKTIKGKEKEWKGAGEPHDQWKLIPHEGQSYFKKLSVIGLEDTYTDWLIIDVSSKEKSQEKETLQTKKDYKEIEKELRFLKKMVGEGLITEEEYNEKKTKLLENL